MSTVGQAMLAMYDQGKTYAVVAGAFKVATSTAWQYIKKERARTDADALGPIAPDSPFSQVDEPISGRRYMSGKTAAVIVPSAPRTVDDFFDRFHEDIGYSGKPPKHIDSKHTPNPNETRIVLMNDLHIPYEHKEAIKWVINREAAVASMLVLGGDITDSHKVSKYPKYEQEYTFVEELQHAKAVLMEFSADFSRVKMMPGNHDDRWMKYLVMNRRMEIDDINTINWLGRQSDPGFDIMNPLRALAQGLPNIELTSAAQKDCARFRFFHQEGDILFSHAEKFSRVPMQAAVTSSNWFQSFGIGAGIVKPFRVFAQCHTHQAGMAWADHGVWVLECGCLSRMPDYSGDSKLRGAPRIPMQGYSVFVQNQGKTDIQRSGFIPYEGENGN